MSSSPSRLPVTVVVTRRPLPGKETELLDWAHGISAAAEAFSGHLGAQIFAPEPPDRNDVVIAFSFASANELETWEHSDVRAEWLTKAATLTMPDGGKTHAVTGFESLFTNRTVGPITPPPKWKTAIIIFIALLPMSLLLNWLLVPLIGDWPMVWRVVLTTAIIVPYMAWIGVPWLSKWLRPWLRRGL